MFKLLTVVIDILLHHSLDQKVNRNLLSELQKMFVQKMFSFLVPNHRIKVGLNLAWIMGLTEITNLRDSTIMAISDILVIWFLLKYSIINMSDISMLSLLVMFEREDLIMDL